MIRRHRTANIAAASGDECIVLLNELVLVYVAGDFLMEDNEERWTFVDGSFQFFSGPSSISAFTSPAENQPPPILYSRFVFSSSFFLVVTRPLVVSMILTLAPISHFLTLLSCSSAAPCRPFPLAIKD